MRSQALAAAIGAITLSACGTAVPVVVEGGTPVPAAIGLSLGQARQLLESSGFAVREEQRLDCLLAQRVEDTTPAPGTPIADGSTVTLTYSDALPGASCAYTAEERAWEFLGWASGREPVQPSFLAPDLAKLAQPPAQRRRAAEIARAAFSLVPTGDGSTAQPRLRATYKDCPPLADCSTSQWVDVTLSLAGHPYAEITLPLTGGRISGFRLESTGTAERAGR